MIHAIIFDMDGVLIDSQPMHYLGDQQTLAAHSVEVPVEEMTAYAGTTNQLRFELFKERYHLDADVADMIREREATMIRLVRESDAVPTEGSVALLESIKADGLKTAVASSSSYPFIYAVLENGMLPVKRTIKNNKFLYRQPCYGWRYFMLLLYIAHDISLVSLHAVSFEVVGCCSNLCN